MVAEDCKANTVISHNAEVSVTGGEEVMTSSSRNKDSSAVALGEFAKNLRLAIPPDTVRKLVDSIRAFYVNVEPIIDIIGNYQKAIYEAIAPAIERLSQLYSDIDWENVAEGSKSWGEYGWIPPEGLSIAQVSNPPASIECADQTALSVLNDERLDALFKELVLAVPKRKDIEEAILLFKGRHYKATAMILCSLIECELIKSDSLSKRRKPKNAVVRLSNELPSEGIALITAPAFANAYAYFFHDANDFDRSVEGELNRNFLQHGMMYKPVRRKTCIKLFLNPALQCVGHYSVGQSSDLGFTL